MPRPFTTTGGARIGWTNATWPLARLEATAHQLTISVGLLGTYHFTAQQVSAVERYTSIPVLGWGIRIRHCRADVPDRVVFWCFGDPDSLLRGIREAGFSPTASAEAAAAADRDGIAVRWPAILAAIVIWNALFLTDFARSEGMPMPGPFALVAVMLAFLSSVGALWSPGFQQLILKPDRNMGEIRPFLRLLTAISAFMAVILSVFLFSGALDRI